MASIQYKLFSNVIAKLPLKLRLKILFFRRFKYFLDFEKAETFNEKLQLRKLKDRSELLTIAAGKLESKKFVSRVLPDIYVPKVLWSGSDLKDLYNLDLNSLPKEYVYKANHTSQTLEFIKDGNHLKLDEMIKLASRWLLHDQAGALGEWAYKKTKKAFFIEEFLDFGGSVPDDYKFFVYHGKVRFVQLDSGRFVSQTRNMFDSEWNDLNFDYSYPSVSPPPVKPVFLNEMIMFAETLGDYFDFIRVDFYYYKKKVTFGELTVYPGAGFEKFPERKYDELFGLYWNQKYN